MSSKLPYTPDRELDPPTTEVKEFATCDYCKLEYPIEELKDSFKIVGKNTVLIYVCKNC